MNQIARFLVVPAPVVLVVEDEFALCDVIADELEAAGYVVITAATGEEAVGILDRQPIDLLLTDIRLPGIVDGWRVAEAATPGAPTCRSSTRAATPSRSPGMRREAGSCASRSARPR